MELGRFMFDSSPSYKRNISFLGNVDPLFTVSKSMVGMKESLKRRPFLCSLEDIYDDEYFDDQMPEKKRRLTPEQVDLLEKSFEAENKLEPERKNQLANKLGLQPRQVAIWFQNRRARWKTKQLEKDYDTLKFSYDSLLSDYNSLLKENEKLKSEVISLSEQLQLKEIIGAPITAQLSDLMGTEEEAQVSAFQFGVKVEDRLSSGTGGSAVIDEDGRQLADSDESYFSGCDTYAEYVAPVNKIQAEDDRSDFSDVFTAAEEEHDNMAEPLGLWVWS